MHVEALNLQDAMIFLFAAGIVVPLVRRLRISPVLAFLAVGVVIGPFGLARLQETLPWLAYAAIDDLEGVRALAELGVVFLLFMIGLELSLDRLWAMRRLVFGLGGAQVIVTGAVIAVIAYLFGNAVGAAMVLGAGFALSSTAIVMQLLTEGHRAATTSGRASFSVLLFQDLAVLPILFLVSAFGGLENGSPWVAFASALGKAGLAIVAILMIGRLALRPLFRLIGMAASREMFLAFVLLVIIGTAMATEEAGLSLALGAFLAGLLFSETEYRHAIEVDIEPFKGLLLGLFFVAVGMRVDVSLLLAKPGLVLGSVLGLFLIKGAILYGLARLFGQSRAVAAETGLLLGQGGEFAFIVVGLALTAELLDVPTAQFMLLVTTLAMVATPPVAQLARRLGLWLEGREASGGAGGAAAAEGISGHVVIAGYGRVGRLLGALLDERGVAYLAIDNDAARVGRNRQSGGVYFGDAGRAEILRRCAPGRAAALVVTMNDPVAAERVVVTAQREWPHVPIYARALDPEHAARLLDAGADHVVPETVEASLQLGEILLMGVGVPDQAARQLIESRRQAEQAALDGRRRRSR